MVSGFLKNSYQKSTKLAALDKFRSEKQLEMKKKKITHLDPNVAKTTIIGFKMSFEISKLFSSCGHSQTVGLVEFKHGPEIKIKSHIDKCVKKICK